MRRLRFSTHASPFSMLPRDPPSLKHSHTSAQAVQDFQPSKENLVTVSGGPNLLRW